MSRSADLAYRVGWAAVRWLPEPAAYALFERIGDWVWSRRTRRVRQLERNLSRVSDDPRALAREGMRMYLRYWCEAFRLPDWDRARIVDTVVTHDEQHLLEALARGGAMVALPHMGNWDHAGAWAAQRFGSVMTVAERLEPESLYRQFLRYRARLGMEVLSHDDPGVSEALVERMRQGGIVALLADRDFTRRGIPVSLLGEQTTFPAGPVRLAQTAGVPLIPAHLWRDGRTLHIEFHAAVPTEHLEQAAQGLADAFDVAIRRHPQEWHVLQKVFTADRGTRAGAAR